MEEKVIIGFLIKQIHIAFETRCHKNLQRYNLTPSQMDVLLYLKKHEEDTLTQRDLETGLTLKNPTVTGLLNRLEEKVLEDAYLYIQELDAKMLNGISEEEQEQLFKHIYKILDNLK